MKTASHLLLFICLNILIGQVDYQTQIQTIFNSNCTSCHVNGGSYFGGLDLSTYANVMNGGNSGVVVIPNDHANSYLWQRVNNGEMPPGNNPDLSSSQIDLIALWIDEGALENPSIVLMGKQAIDDDCNQTGQMLSALLGWSQGTFISKLDVGDSNVSITREIDEGLEMLKLNLPSIITCDLRLNEPRYASLPNIMKAKKKAIEQIIAKDLGVDIANRIQQLKVEEPPKRKGGTKVNSVAELVSKLKNEAKVI